MLNLTAIARPVRRLESRAQRFTETPRLVDALPTEEQQDLWQAVLYDANTPERDTIRYPEQ